MDRIYIVTGATGHLGCTIVRSLCAKGEDVRCVVMAGDRSHALDGLSVETVVGDVRDISTLGMAFSGLEDREAIVIHSAGIVSIKSVQDENIHDVNVRGTANIVDMCRKHRVRRLIYVSSVHAIQEGDRMVEICETATFSPDLVAGQYAKSKAEATRLVLESSKDGLDCVVIHPSGICGPNDFGMGHMTQFVKDFMEGRLVTGVRGGYDFVDVRDVADGIIAAADRGRSGECYILSNRYYSVQELFDVLAEVSGHRRVKRLLPFWFASATAPLAEIWYRMRGETPLFTRYSLFALSSSSNFSHCKADLELGYTTRDMRETMSDTIAFLNSRGM